MVLPGWNKSNRLKITPTALTVSGTALTDITLPIYLRQDNSGLTDFDSSIVFDELNSIDPYWNNVVLLLSMDGVDGSTVFTDTSISQHAITTYDGANISTAQSVYGGSSAYFDGSSDYLYIPYSPDFSLTSLSTFTIEFWFYTLVVGGSHTILAKSNGAGQLSYTISMSDTYLRFTVYTNGAGSSGASVGASYTSKLNTWCHAAIAADTGLIRMFVSGELLNTGVVPNFYDSTTTPFVIGYLNYPSYPYWLNGYLDEVRFTKDICRYYNSFTVPNTSLAMTTPEYSNSVLNKKIAIEIGSTKTECSIQIPPSSWDTVSKEAMILATMPYLDFNTELFFYYDITHEGNLNVTDVDPLPDPPTGQDDRDAYDLCILDTFWSISLEEFFFTFSGHIQLEGEYVIREVSMYNRQTFELVDSTVSDYLGYFELFTQNTGAHFVNVFPELADTYNILSYDKIEFLD
jgi:hypothetical protein